MKKINKKGFTIVELVIVIAVIAILAAVLIPTFSSLVKTAQTSSDVNLVKNLNTSLTASEILDGKNETMTDALKKGAISANYFINNCNQTMGEYINTVFISKISISVRHVFCPLSKSVTCLRR